MNEKQYHLDAIADIDELLKEINLVNPEAYQCYDVAGVGEILPDEKNEN
tara:strand:- start:1544 stop:1690 length:147 start_codon:yes stop_codon:yes gene_type:complete